MILLNAFTVDIVALYLNFNRETGVTLNTTLNLIDTYNGRYDYIYTSNITHFYKPDTKLCYPNINPFHFTSVNKSKCSVTVWIPNDSVFTKLFSYHNISLNMPILNIYWRSIQQSVFMFTVTSSTIYIYSIPDKITDLSINLKFLITPFYTLYVPNSSLYIVYNLYSTNYLSLFVRNNTKLQVLVFSLSRTTTSKLLINETIESDIKDTLDYVNYNLTYFCSFVNDKNTDILYHLYLFSLNGFEQFTLSLNIGDYKGITTSKALLYPFISKELLPIIPTLNLLHCLCNAYYITLTISMKPISNGSSLTLYGHVWTSNQFIQSFSFNVDFLDLPINFSIYSCTLRTEFVANNDICILLEQPDVIQLCYLKFEAPLCNIKFDQISDNDILTKDYLWNITCTNVENIRWCIHLYTENNSNETISYARDTNKLYLSLINEHQLNNFNIKEKYLVSIFTTNNTNIWICFLCNNFNIDIYSIEMGNSDCQDIKYNYIEQLDVTQKVLNIASNEENYYHIQLTNSLLLLYF